MASNIEVSNIERRPRRRWLSWVLLLLLLLVSYGAGVGSAVWYYEGWQKKPANGGDEAVFYQTGRFRTISGETGAVQFPIPYRLAPNLELNLVGPSKTLVTETTPEGFRWKNIGSDDIFNNAEATWHAKGIRRLQADAK